MSDLRDILDGLRARPYVVGNKARVNNYPSAASVQWVDDSDITRTIGSCLRQQWYSFKGFKPPSVGPSSARMSRILELGNVYADIFVREIKEAGLWVGDEIPFQLPELRLSGRIDGLIKDPDQAPPPPARPAPSQLMGIEFKTTAGYYNVKGPIISTRDTPLKPKPEHVLQCCIYLAYYKKFGIKKWLLAYIDRALGQSENNPTHWNIHTISFDDDEHPVITNDQGTKIWTHFTLESIFDRYRQLNKYVDDDTLPDRDYSLQYTNTVLLRMYGNGELNKGDTTGVNAKIKKLKKPIGDITNDDPLLLTKGDWQCRFCDFAETCYSNTPDKPDTPALVAEEVKAPPPPEPEEAPNVA